MHIEDIERDNLKTLSDKDLFSVRLRFIQVWNKNFRKSIGIPLVGGLSRSEILDRYELVAKELSARGLSVKRRGSIDLSLFHKTMVGIDVPAFGDVTLVPDYISICGEFFSQPDEAGVVDIVVKSQHENPGMEIKVSKSIRSQVEKKTAFMYNPTGPYSPHIPVFDLVLRAKSRTGKIDRPDGFEADEQFRHYKELEEWTLSRIHDGAALSKAVKGFNPVTVLVVGCGPGRIFPILRSVSASEVVGTDNNIVAVEMAKQKGLKVSLGFIEELGFQDNSFDVVVAEHSLVRAKDRGKALAEMMRVAKSGVVAVTEVVEGDDVGCEVGLSDGELKELDAATYTVSNLFNGNALIVGKKKSAAGNKEFDLVMKPFPNEHAARQNPPSKYVRFRRENNKFGPGIHVIWGITSDQKTEIQSIRFSASKFTPEQARKWLKEHKYKTNLEVATKKSTSSELRFEIQKSNSAQHIVSGIVYAPNEVDSHGEYATAEAITEGMLSFMESTQLIRLNHEEPLNCCVLECFQAGEDTHKEGTLIPAGAWWLSVRVRDPDVWQAIIDEEITGFSMAGLASRSE